MKEITMMGWYQNGAGWAGSGGVGGWAMVAVCVGLIALAVWWIARMTRTQSHSSIIDDSPRTILDRRFASGDIDAEAYAHARRILEGRAPTPQGR
jgi:putative membrane protein